MGETVFNLEGLGVGNGSSQAGSAIQLFEQCARQAQLKFESMIQSCPP